MMSRASSTDVECKSDLPIWGALVCCALALVAFFGWITTSESALFSQHQKKDLYVQPASDSLSEQAAQRASHQRREAEHAADNRTVASQSELVNDVTGDAIAGSGRGLPELSDEELSDVEILPASSTAQKKEQTKAQTKAQTEAQTEAQTNKRDLATGNSDKGSFSQSQPASVDLDALRQLLAEATAISSNEDEQVRDDRKRLQTLGSLGELSASIRFAPGSKVVTEIMEPTLRQIGQILADYPETSIIVTVAGNENADVKKDLLLSQERGRILIARLVNEGLAFSRFSLEALSDEQLPANSHKVEILAHSES